MNTVRPGIAKETMKFFFTKQRLPNFLRDLDPAYKKIRYVSIKLGKILKPVVMSNKTPAVLSALSTTNALLNGTSLSSFPIILCATGAALASYYGEKRKESVTRAQATLDTVNIPRSYELTKVVLQKHSYTFPRLMEVVKMGLDLSMTGITCGASSYSFMLAGGTLAYNIYSEAKSYSKISKLKSSLEKKLTKLTPQSTKQEQIKKITESRMTPLRTPQIQKTQERLNRSNIRRRDR